MLSLEWHRETSDVPAGYSFQEEMSWLLRGGEPAGALPETMAKPTSAIAEGSLIRLGLPAMILRAYLRGATPGMTVRQFVVWMLGHGVPFGWARPGPPGNAAVELPLQFLAQVPTYQHWQAQLAALLQEKPWARAFALDGGIGWRLTMLVGGQDYANAVGLGPSARAQRHGEELGWPADYTWDEARGRAYDILTGRSGRFSLWPPQDVWDTIVGNGIWTPAHEEWFQKRLTVLNSQEGTGTARAIHDDHWWPLIKYGVYSEQRRTIKSHLPQTWVDWAARAGVQPSSQAVLLPLGDQPL